MRQLRLTLLAVTLLVLLAGIAGATTWYISPTGNNANPGTQEAPLKTFKAGVAKLTQDGDELVLKPGQYNGEGIVMVERPGAADYVTIRAEVPGTAKVWGRISMWGLQVASYTKLQGIWFSGNPSVFAKDTQTDLHHIWVEDCQFKSTEESIAATGSRCAWPLSLPWCQYVTVRNCLFRECMKFAALGSKAGPTVYHVLVENCTFAHNWNATDWNVDGIVIDGPDHVTDQDIVLRNCVSWGHGDAGYDIKLKATIENCVAYENNWGFKIWANGTRLINCLAYNNVDCGFGLANAGQEAWNCTSIGNGLWGMRIHDKAVKVRNSIIVGGVKDSYNDGPAPDGYYERIPDVDYSVFWLSSPEAIAYSPKHELWNLTFAQLANRINPVRPQVAYAGFGDHMVYADPQLGDNHEPPADSAISVWGYRAGRVVTALQEIAPGGAIVPPPPVEPPVDPPIVPPAAGPLSAEDRAALDFLKSLLQLLRLAVQDVK